MELFFGFCKYSCGHVEKIQVPEDKAGMIMEQPMSCKLCRDNPEQNIKMLNERQAKLLEKHKDEITGNLTKKAKVKVPDITAKSDKAKDYANSIIEKFIEKWTVNGELLEKAKDIVMTETDAQFWFDNKGELGNLSFIEEYVVVDKSRLTKLTGSEAQVKWAEKIRVDMIKRCTGKIDEEQLEKILEYEITAKFWIDNRENMEDAEWVDSYVPDISKELLKNLNFIGSEKQIKKAKVIAKKLLKYSQEYLDADYQEKAINIIKSQTDAAWYIENERRLYNQDFINKATISNEHTLVKEDQVKLDTFINKRDNEISIKPDNFNGIIVKLSNNNETLIVQSEVVNDKGFQVFLKENMIYFSTETKVWQRHLDELTGTYMDRAAELGVKLLELGFGVCVYNARVRKMIREKNYLPEQTKWVVNADSKHVALLARDPSKILSKEAMALPGAHHHENIKGILVPYTAAKEILRFAQKNHYQITDIVRLKLRRHIKE